MPKQTKRTLSAEDKRDIRRAKRLSRPAFGSCHRETSEKYLIEHQKRRDKEAMESKLKLVGAEDHMEQLTIEETINQKQKLWNCSQRREQSKAFGLQKKKENGIRKRLRLPKDVRTDSTARELLIRGNPKFKKKLELFEKIK